MVPGDEVSVKLARIKYTNHHLKYISGVLCVYLHLQLCPSGLDPKDKEFWQELFIARTILSLPFIFHKSQNLLGSALTFNFLGFVSLSQTLNLI